MSLRLKQTESPGQAVRRVCRRHVDQALANLDQAHQPEGVHEVRKEIKRMRAIFRLTRGSLSQKEHRKTAKLMRLAAKPLAASRDARVTRRAFESLVGRKARQFPNLQSALQTYGQHAERSFKTQDFGALTRFILKKAGGRLDDWKPNQAGWTEIKACLKKSYACGRSAGKLARLKPEPDHFHEWRKEVKNLWYQLDFLCPDWPPKTKATLQGLEELGEQLGDEHDLVLLEDFAKEHAEFSQETAALQVLIEAQRSRFGERVRQLGARLYASRPELFCGQLDQDWKAWRKRQAP
jgi:CHAD domain-containing protein